MTIFPYAAVTALQVGPDLVATLPVDWNNDRRLERLAITGPAGSIAAVYVNTISPSNLLDTAPRGNINTAEYSNPIAITRGSTVIVVWPGATGNANATFYFRLN